MAIDRELRDRMELELAGYRSAKHLGRYAAWLFYDDNVSRAIATGYLLMVDNGTFKSSPYYMLTGKGKKVLKQAGRGFTYGDAQGKKTVSYQRAGKNFYRSVKVTTNERRQRAEALLAAFRELVTDDSSHARLALEKKGWFPGRTAHPDWDLIKQGLVEYQDLGSGRTELYFRLTPVGKRRLVALRRRKLAAQQVAELEALRTQQMADTTAMIRRQASELQALSRRTDVRNWHHLTEKADLASR